MPFLLSIDERKLPFASPVFFWSKKKPARSELGPGSLILIIPFLSGTVGRDSQEGDRLSLKGSAL